MRATPWFAVALGLFALATAQAQESTGFVQAESLEELQKLVARYAEQVPGRTGVYLLHVESGREVMVNGDVQFQLASVCKVPLLVTLYKQIDEGKYSLDDRVVLTQAMKTYGSGLLTVMRPGLNLTINDLQLLMMAVSDNTATDILFEMVGAPAIATYMRELGLTRTIIDLDTRALILGYLGLDMRQRLTIAQLDRVPAEVWGSEARRAAATAFDNTPHNWSTPREIGMIWAKLVRGEIVDRATSDTILATLRHHTGARLITRYLPFGVGAARKGGSLGRDGVGAVLLDSGVVFLPGDAGHLVVCVFGNDLSAEPYEFEIAAGLITRAGFDFFTAEGK